MNFLGRVRRDPVWAYVAALALAYAFLAGWKTVADFDLGWQLATGRYIAQHHSIPSTDVLSYTAAGREWLYPPFSGLFFYLLAKAGGWTALSWLNALACLAVVGILVWHGRRLTALLAFLAVPAIDFRTEARAELFTTLLFAVYAVLLWRHYRGQRVSLWLLPVVMAAWVNLHPGFAAGLLLLAAYVFIELAEFMYPSRRGPALARLRRAAPWIALSALATLLNPWGYRIYEVLIRQSQAGELHSAFIGEWSSIRLNTGRLHELVNFRSAGSGDWWLLLAGAVGAVLYVLRLRLAPALLLAGGAYLSLLHIRFQALFAILVVVLAGSLPDEFPPAAAETGSPNPWRQWLWSPPVRKAAASALLTGATLLAGVRMNDLVTNRHYIVDGQVSLFGAGPSWWFPERAADFVERERLPGQIFNDVDLGGYLAWRLGPQYPVYVDSRYLPYGTQFLLEKNHLMSEPPSSADWRREEARRNINLAIFSLSRYGELEHAPLQAFCASPDWQLVYLDEVSALFLRNRPENAAWLERLHLDCRTAPIQPPQEGVSTSWGRAEQFEFWANAGSVFYLLSRDAEALAALDRANQIFGDDPNLHLIRAQFFEATGQTGRAEHEFRASLDLARTDAAWFGLGRLYAATHHFPEAAACLRESAKLSTRGYDRYLLLAQVYLAMGEPRQALEALDRAARQNPFEGAASPLGAEFGARLAESRCQAWAALRDFKQSEQFARQAISYTPQNPKRWLLLADIYAAEGKPLESARARQNALALASGTRATPVPGPGGSAETPPGAQPDQPGTAPSPPAVPPL